MPNPDQAIEDLKALLEKTAGRPWRLAVGDHTHRFALILDADERTVFYKYGAGTACEADQDEGDAALIVALVNAAPSLISKAHEAEGLAKEVERLSKIAARLPNFTAALGDEIALRETAEREAEGLKAEVERLTHLEKVAGTGLSAAMESSAIYKARAITAKARILQLDAALSEVIEFASGAASDTMTKRTVLGRARQAREGVAS